MNKVIITNARLTKDVDLRFAQGSGKAVARFSIAVNRQFKKDEVDFLNCITFGKMAETISTYFQKGSPINIEGSIQTGKYTNKEGNTVYTTDIIVNGFEFVAGQKKDNQGPSQSNNSFDDMIPIDDDGDIPF